MGDTADALSLLLDRCGAVTITRSKRGEMVVDRVEFPVRGSSAFVDRMTDMPLAHTARGGDPLAENLSDAIRVAAEFAESPVLR